jgi:hypothetical protein
MGSAHLERSDPNINSCKVKLFLYMSKGIWSVEVQLHPILILAVDGGKWLSSCTGHFIPQGKNPQNPLNMGLGGPITHSVYFGEEKNLIPLPGLNPR